MNNANAINLWVHPEQATKRLLSVLQKRTRDIIEMRFGLGRSEPMTLEAIGDKYGITRERVRQIESDAIKRIQRSSEMGELQGLFSDLEYHFENAGGVLREEHALEALSPQPKHERHVDFLLSLHKPFQREYENDDFYARWVQKKAADDNAQKTISRATEEIRSNGHAITEPKLFEVLSSSAQGILGIAPPKAVLANWVGISKNLAKNYYGEWGLIEFPTIRPRGVRDLSFMVMSKAGSPLHFSEVAKKISELISKKAHVQTVHNELIKDNRFVLVGRGMYALKEWGYETGTVKDIIARVLATGPLSKDDVVRAVSEKRMVKENTITVNLDNKRQFKRLEDGRYSLR